jgi:hypothetical protein
MRIRFLQLFIAFLSLTLARQLVAANIAVTTSASPRTAGTVAGGGSFPSGSSITVVATADDCYNFVDWTRAGVKVSGETSYTITNVTRSEALTAIFALKQYTVSTGSSPTNGGTTSGGGKKGCGSVATLTAHAKPGFAFMNWTEVGDTNVTIPTATCRIPVSDNASFVANFKDIKPPTVTIYVPGNNKAIANAGFAIQGTATDNVGVAAVYYNLNGSGWVPTGSTNGFSSWYAWVSVKPDGPNTISAYAVDDSGNKSTNTVHFICSAAGFAPLSIAGAWAAVTEGTNTQDSFLISFDLAGYVRVSANTNDSGEVGTYTYTPTGPDTAELVPHGILPTPDSGPPAVVELNFADGFTATYSDSSGGSGVFYFSPAADLAPETLDGATIIGTSYTTPHFGLTNTFGASTFTSETTAGRRTIGTYTFTKFTPIAGLLIETPTAPRLAIGTTDYIVLSFTTNTMPPNGNYNYQAVGGQGVDAGSFLFDRGVDNTKFLGPVTLSGLQVQVTPAGEPVFTRTYGNGTFASLSLKSTNEPTDVGIYLANTHVSANTGTDKFMALAPPYAVGSDDDMLDLTFGAKSSYTYSVVGDPNERGTARYTKALATVPEALTGQTITATPTGVAKTSVITFTYNNFNKTKGTIIGDGTYTYSAYSPSMALVTVVFADGTEIGKTEDIFLDFVTISGGHFVYARPNAAVAGGWEFSSGPFTLTKSKL